MQKINVSGHELEIKKEYVEEFERTVCDSLEKMAKIYLLIEFEWYNKYVNEVNLWIILLF